MNKYSILLVEYGELVKKLSEFQTLAAKVTTVNLAITINPAKHLGVADRVGSLEVGKDADLVITDGDPMVSDTTVKMVFINGRHRAVGAGHDLRDQMTLGAVFQGELEAELPGNADSGADVVCPVGVGLQGNLALEYGDERFHFQVEFGLLLNVVSSAGPCRLSSEHHHRFIGHSPTVPLPLRRAGSQGRDGSAANRVSRSLAAVDMRAELPLSL